MCVCREDGLVFDKGSSAPSNGILQEQILQKKAGNCQRNEGSVVNIWPAGLNSLCGPQAVACPRLV